MVLLFRWAAIVYCENELDDTCTELIEILLFARWTAVSKARLYNTILKDVLLRYNSYLMGNRRLYLRSNTLIPAQMHLEYRSSLKGHRSQWERQVDRYIQTKTRDISIVLLESIKYDDYR